MSVYTVHQPPLREAEAAADPARFVFVRDGFHLWAFLLTPLWILWHRLWLVLLLFIALNLVIGVALYFAGASGGVKFAIAVLIGLLAGFEAATLRRWTLARRGWTTLGVVVGDDVESAERRFFADWLARVPETAAVPQPPPVAAIRRMPPAQDIIGLFPDSRAPR